MPTKYGMIDMECLLTGFSRLLGVFRAGCLEQSEQAQATLKKSLRMLGLHFKTTILTPD